MKKNVIVILLLFGAILSVGCREQLRNDDSETLSLLREKHPALFAVDYSEGIQVACIPKGDQIFDYWVVSIKQDSILAAELIKATKEGLMDQNEVKVLIKYYQIPSKKVVLRLCFTPLSSYYHLNDLALANSFDLSELFDGKYNVSEVLQVEY